MSPHRWCAARARAQATGDVVAVKRLDRQRITGRQGDWVVDEIALLKRVRHPHIVALQDFTVSVLMMMMLPMRMLTIAQRRRRRTRDAQWSERWIYVVTEYCAGGDLAAYMRVHAPLAEPLALACLQQLGAVTRRRGRAPSPRRHRWSLVAGR